LRLPKVDDGLLDVVDVERDAEPGCLRCSCDLHVRIDVDFAVSDAAQREWDQRFAAQ
jgi:hypothetical protein